jgi:hypothetical protein
MGISVGATLPKGRKDVVTEIEEMSRAIMAGNCELARGPFSLTSKIHVGDYTYKVTDFPMFPIPPFWTRRYASYAPITSRQLDNER